MNTVSEDLGARLADGVSTTCLCWKLIRRDGLIVGVSDHDRALVVDHQSYTPGAALEQVELTRSVALAPDRAAASGALASDAITEADLASGLWDGARIEVRRADWRRPEFHTLIWSGRFSEITHGARGFEAQLVSLKADLERPVGRSFGRRCDAVLGDARCQVDLADPAFAGETCDQHFRTCRDVFQNTENFRGFPHMPGNDFVLAGPAANGEVEDAQ